MGKKGSKLTQKVISTEKKMHFDITNIVIIFKWIWRLVLEF
jgi:hypothetical protein